MAFQREQMIERIEPAKEALRKFISTLIIDTMSARQALFRALNYSQENDPKINAYRNFVCSFSSLFAATKDNIRESGRIVGWDRKKEVAGKIEEYESFLSENTSETLDNLNNGLILFDKFLGVLVQSGLYSLIEEVGIGEEGFPEEAEAVADQ